MHTKIKGGRYGNMFTSKIISEIYTLRKAMEAKKNIPFKDLIQVYGTVTLHIKRYEAY